LQYKDDIGNQSHASATSFYLNIPEPNNMKDTSPQDWKRLTFAKASPTSEQPSPTSAPATPSFRPKDDYTIKFLINYEGGLSIIYFPTTTEQWQQHKEQQRHEPRLTHRLIKHLMSALPDNYIIHNEDHANAHLMIYCPNVYNQAAFNTWMQWSKGRTIIAYSNTCVGRLLRVAALALQQMLKATWPHHFGNIATPQLWQEVHELFQANEEQPERADIIQSVRYLIAEFSKTNNDILLIISPILSTCAIVSTEIMYVDDRAIIVDKEALHSNPYIWQLASATFYILNNGVTGYLSQQAPENFASAATTAGDGVELTDVDSDSDVDQLSRYVNGSAHASWRANHGLLFRKYRWTSALLAHMVRACTHTNFSTVSLLHNVNMAAHVDKYNQPGSTNVLVRPGQCHRQDASNDDYNHSIRVKSMALADAHSLACDMAIQHTEITAYSLLEVTHDLRMLVHLAQTNKATWLRCNQVLTSTSTECKMQSNAPWHKRAGRAIDGNHVETPIDIKMYLFNKRMHTWYHHELSYQQYMDLQVHNSGGHYGQTPDAWPLLLFPEKRASSAYET
ncbi:unnamed protein product, partial [Symbiodinium necroappetens]